MHEAETEAKIALILSQFLRFDPIFSKRNEICGRFSTELENFWLKTGFNTGLY